MNQNVSYRTVLVFLAMALLSGGYADAHDEFKDVMKDRYTLKSVSCKACHTDNKDKKIRNAFGKLLHKELKDKRISEGYRESKQQGEEAHEKFEKEMAKHFLVALKKVEKKQLSFASLLNAGLLNGIRLDKDQVDVDSLTIKVTEANPAKRQTPKSDEPVGKGAKVIKGQVKPVPSKKPAPEAPSAETKKVDGTQ